MPGRIIADTFVSRIGRRKLNPHLMLSYNHTTPAVRDGYNVSSVTDNSVGNYTVNYTAGVVSTITKRVDSHAMQDTAGVITTDFNNKLYRDIQTTTRTRCQNGAAAGGAGTVDATHCYVVVWGDTA